MLSPKELEEERKEIISRYRKLLQAARRTKKSADWLLIRKAFDLALESHDGVRRKSGEPYIYHPIAVAQIVAEEIGLGTTSIVCALLHDVVEDTDITLDDIESIFGSKVASIIDGLTKIEDVFDNTSSIQAENFRKILLTLSDDVRVILIKLADRLHNMRTLESMKEYKQRKIAAETLYLYAPLAHRLGLYNIKIELEDLGLKYTEPLAYKEIEEKLEKTKAVRERFINQFQIPIQKALQESGMKFEIKGRPKSIYSIWNKMQKKGIPFEEVYDVFAIRVILDSDVIMEKADCWRAYSIVTDFYKPNPDRLRDWISTPKTNGYEALHTTVMSPTGKWVEVQIRTKRMDEIAEKGFAAHWKYKAGSNESALDEWIARIREMLENPDSNALDFIDDFKLNLFSDEILVFTPKGDIFTLPYGSTVLDFAFEVHTEIGEKCIGAKINFKLEALSHHLKTGDQVEILTSAKQTPKEEWLNFVVTAKAKSKIKSFLKEERKQLAEKGKDILKQKLNLLNVEFDEFNINNLMYLFKQNSTHDLFYQIAVNKISLKDIDPLVKNGKIEFTPPAIKEKTIDELVKQARGNSDLLVLGDDVNNINYKLSPCCNPIPGDDVFGFITMNDGILIHRVNCPNAVPLLSNFAYQIVKAKWNNNNNLAFLAGIKINGFDQVGIVNKITQIISSELNVNMRSISFDSNDGIFEGLIMVYVQDTNHLDQLIENLKKVTGVINVERIDNK
jgi:GTP diphosphokinase / guanosine-3',5'-bis(diphosphate) 3'-diphosphatase